MDLERGARLTRYSPTAEAGLTPLDWCSLLRRPHHHVSGEAGYARNSKQRIVDPCQRAKHRQVSGETVGPEDSIVPHLKIWKMLAYDRELGLTKGLFVRRELTSNRNQVAESFQPPRIGDWLIGDELTAGPQAAARSSGVLRQAVRRDDGAPPHTRQHHSSPRQDCPLQRR